ncbi:MAG: hypothetical protein ACJ77B_05625 [Chloroflexota bacterium]
MLNTDDVVRAVCRLPRDVNSLGTMSPVELLRRSGYSERRAEIPVDGIEVCLRANPEYVDDWLLWSEQDRGYSGWYLFESHAGELELRPYDQSVGRQSKAFTDKTRAAAEFAHRYLENLVRYV